MLLFIDPVCLILVYTDIYNISFTNLFENGFRSNLLAIRGLDEELIRKHWDRCVRIPMNEGCRSLNLAVAAAVVLYEALRQSDFSPLSDDTGRDRNVFG